MTATRSLARADRPAAAELPEHDPAELRDLPDHARRFHRRRKPGGASDDMLRSDNLRTAMWADEVIKRHILPETSKHTSGLAGWYSPRNDGVADSAQRLA